MIDPRNNPALAGQLSSGQGSVGAGTLGISYGTAPQLGYGLGVQSGVLTSPQALGIAPTVLGMPQAFGVSPLGVQYGLGVNQFGTIPLGISQLAAAQQAPGLSAAAGATPIATMVASGVPIGVQAVPSQLGQQQITPLYGFTPFVTGFSGGVQYPAGYPIAQIGVGPQPFTAQLGQQTLPYTSLLGIQSPFGAMTSRLQEPTKLDDETIAEIVQEAIDLDPFIPVRDKGNIDVQCEQGKVVLSGIVRNRRSKALSYADAFAIPGVQDVETNIKVERKSEKRVPR